MSIHCVILQPSLTGHSRVVTHDVPVGVVPRRLWTDLAEPEMPDFDVCSSEYLMNRKFAYMHLRGHFYFFPVYCFQFFVFIHLLNYISALRYYVVLWLTSTCITAFEC